MPLLLSPNLAVAEDAVMNFLVGKIKKTI